MFTVKLLDWHPYVIYYKAKPSQSFLLSFSDLFQLFRCPFSSVNSPSFSCSLCTASGSHRNLPSQCPLSSFIRLGTFMSVLHSWRHSQISCVPILLVSLRSLCSGALLPCHLSALVPGSTGAIPQQWGQTLLSRLPYPVRSLMQGEG